jgi:hypothetical protein
LESPIWLDSLFPSTLAMGFRRTSSSNGIFLICVGLSLTQSCETRTGARARVVDETEADPFWFLYFFKNPHELHPSFTEFRNSMPQRKRQFSPDHRPSLCNGLHFKHRPWACRVIVAALATLFFLFSVFGVFGLLKD